MKPTSKIALALALAGALGCSKGSTASGESGKFTKEDYTLVFLKTGPKDAELPKEERDEAFKGHFSNMLRMAEEKKLLVAGPFGKVKHDNELRGLFVLDTPKRDEATEWASTDPPTQLGIFVLEYHDLRTAAPLRAALERDLAAMKKAKDEGKKLPAEDGMRTYVILTADDGKLARSELKTLRDSGGLLMLSNYDQTGAFALLDSRSIADAKERYGPILEKIGAHTLDEWTGSGELARLNANGADTDEHK